MDFHADRHSGRFACAVVAIGSCVYVVGGQDVLSNDLKSAEVFDTTTNTWSAAISL